MNISIEKRCSMNSDEQLLAQHFNNKYNISKLVSEILVTRGIKCDSDLEEFLSMSTSSFSNPFILSGMKEVVDRIMLAKECNHRVVIYGDYDADGICATYILVKSLQKLGIKIVQPYIPNRSDGYGLNKRSIDEINESISPNLIITCDLGISCKNEIDYILSLGIDVLVSDHHELPKELPNCPCINPKFDIGKYPCTDLCGAGVAFKISQALLPNDYMDYIEYACIATVADSVKLQKENRAIVKFGLKKLNNNPDNSLKILIESCGIRGEITSSTIAFIIAPRINASGRMGIAIRSLNMLLSKDKYGTKKLVDEINADNLLRQKSCDEIFKDCYTKFSKDSNNYACILFDEKWTTGLLGIVASKMTEEFYRPAILFSPLDEEQLRGSGRSIDGINLYEMLSTMTDLFVTFGGHSQACGLTIKRSNFNEFKRRVEAYLKTKVSINSFIPKVFYDINTNSTKLNYDIIKELSVLEPYGVGNPKPYFLKTYNSMMIECMKNYPNHLIGKGDCMEIRAFSYGKYLSVFRSEITKKLLLDYSISSLNSNTYIQGNVKDLYTNVAIDKLDEKQLIYDYLFNMEFCVNNSINDEDYSKLVNNCAFGVLSIANTITGYEKLSALSNNTTFIEEGNAIVVKSNINKVLLSPKTTVNFDKYFAIVLEEPFSPILKDNYPEHQNIYTLNDYGFINKLNLTTDRVAFGQCYKAFKSLENNLCLGYNNILVALKKQDIPNDMAMFSFAVFKELKLISIVNGNLIIENGKKVQLTDSKLYSYLLNL